MEPNNHVWSFSTVGGVKRVNLETGEDLANLASLDQKLWTALSCPVNDLEIDKKTLQLVDTDKDGQIRVPEVIAAVEWVIGVLKNPNDLLKQDAVFPLSAINDKTEQGRTLLDSAKVILKNLGKETETTLTVGNTSDTEKIFAGTRFNGDGIITEDSTEDAALLALLKEIMAAAGAATDRGGKQGISADILQSFIDESEKFVAWHAKREADVASIMPLGDNTDAAYKNYIAIRPKVQDYFMRSKLAAFDPLATHMLNLQLARVETITDKNLAGCIDDIAGYPLARIEPDRPLNIVSGINPAWESAIATFKTLTASWLLPGKDSITEADWNTISETFAPYAKWISEEEGKKVEALGVQRVREILSSPLIDGLKSLIEQDKAVEKEATNIILVDQLVRYYRDLYTLLKNFVTFYDFYSPGSKAIFQAGTLYIDQRSCELCIKVTDAARHNALDPYSGMYLLYCDCVSKSTNEKMSIVAALTNGDVDNLVVGRNALFYDRKGMDWDATITKITENPISIRQAFFAPYRKLSRFIETQINKAAASQDEKVNASMSKNVETVPLKQEEDKAKKESQSSFDMAKYAGIFAAIGLALGAIGSMLTAAIGGFLKLAWYKIPFAVLGILLVISGPSMIMAYLKLRKRNLAPLLDANGWAINARVVVNIQFGNTLTHLAELPKGAKVSLNDPFMKKKRPILPALLIILIVAAITFYLLWKYGFMHMHF